MNDMTDTKILKLFLIVFLVGGINNNIFAQDPIFINAGEFPYSIKKASPCRNTGTPDTTGLHIPLSDLAGESRVYDSIIDMGAYECTIAGIEIVDTPTFYPEAGIYFGGINVGINSTEGATIYTPPMVLIPRRLMMFTAIQFMLTARGSQR